MLPERPGAVEVASSTTANAISGRTPTIERTLIGTTDPVRPPQLVVVEAVLLVPEALAASIASAMSEKCSRNLTMRSVAGLRSSG